MLCTGAGHRNITFCFPTAWLGPLRKAQEIAQQNHDFGSLDSNLFSPSLQASVGWAWFCSSLSSFGACPPPSALLFKAPLPASFPGSGGHFQTPMAFRARLGPGATRCAPGSRIGAGRGGMKRRWGYPSWLGRAAGDWAVLIGSGRCNRISAIVIPTARS